MIRDQHRGVHRAVLAVAERPDVRVAYVAEDGTETRYDALADASLRFAGALTRRGVRPSDRVAIVVDGRVEYLVAYLGTLAAGAVAVPLCPDTRADELRHALGSTEAVACVIEARNLGHLRRARPDLPALREVIVIDAPTASAAAVGAEGNGSTSWGSALSEGAGAADGVGGAALAAIVFTSGTSGRPKGVMLSHDNILANARSIVHYLGLGPQDVAAMSLPYYYAYGGSVIATHLMVGARVAAVGSLAFAARMLENVAARACTGLPGVPATFARLLALDPAEVARHDLSALRYATQAGAAMPAEHALAWQARFPRVALHVMYGQTEATARLAHLPPADLQRKAGAIGRAIPGVTLEVLDDQSRVVPPGTTGMLVARGENVMQGYWRDEAATAQVLRDGALWTGDHARSDEEGILWLVGRASEMIKRGAHRIAPEEIERTIASHPAVAECAVAGVPDPLMGEEIVAWVVARPGFDVQPAQVLRHCLDRLPRFKVPREIRLRAELPRTPSGKVHRAALRAA